LAVWFGGLYCFLGCEMGTAAAATPAVPHHGMDHEGGKAMDNACTDGCCKKPVKPSHHDSNDSEMACCRATFSIAIEKTKPPKLTPVSFLHAADEIVPPTAKWLPAGEETPKIDFGETYLRLHVLRI